MPAYERERLKRIRNNNRQLLEMVGLIVEADPESHDDAAYLRSLLSAPAYMRRDLSIETNEIFPPPPPPCIVFIPHINVPSTAILTDDSWIPEYRSFIVRTARSAAERLTKDSILVVGVKDVRIRAETCQSDPHEAAMSDLCLAFDELSLHDSASGSFGGPGSASSAAPATAPGSHSKRFNLPTRLVPLSILVTEDLVSQTQDKLRLKDFTSAVPEGYGLDKMSDVSELKCRLREDDEEWQAERRAERSGRDGCRRVLPIVHAIFLVFVKKE
eukprot:jgi/Hompol1/1626/HPOL_005675-RA